ncbi:hypothetical protein AGIG_G15594 [Arapaima gigas]
MPFDLQLLHTVALTLLQGRRRRRSYDARALPAYRIFTRGGRGGEVSPPIASRGRGLPVGKRSCVAARARARQQRSEKTDSE